MNRKLIATLREIKKSVHDERPRKEIEGLIDFYIHQEQQEISKNPKEVIK